MTSQATAIKANAILTSIDATVDGLCACGCGHKLDPHGPSAWFASPACQTRWGDLRVTRPEEVHHRPDAAAYPRGDGARVPLRPPQPATRGSDREAFDHAWQEVARALADHWDPDAPREHPWPWGSGSRSDGDEHPWVEDLDGIWHHRPPDDTWTPHRENPEVQCHATCGRNIASCHVSGYHPRDIDPYARLCQACVRCVGTTQAGTRCGLSALRPDSHCHLHRVHLDRRMARVRQ